MSVGFFDNPVGLLWINPTSIGLIEGRRFFNSKNNSVISIRWLWVRDHPAMIGKTGMVVLDDCFNRYERKEDGNYYNKELCY